MAGWIKVNGKWIRGQQANPSESDEVPAKATRHGGAMLERKLPVPDKRKPSVTSSDSEEFPVLRQWLHRASSDESAHAQPKLPVAVQDRSLSKSEPMCRSTDAPRPVAPKAKKAVAAVRLSGSFPGGTPRLVLILRDKAAGNNDKAEVCNKIANLCSASQSKNSLVHDALANEGAVEALANLARTNQEDDLLYLALIALERLLDGHEESQRRAWDAGCVDIMLGCLRDGSQKTQEAASSGLIHLSKGAEKRLKESNLAKPDALALIISRIKYELSSDFSKVKCENCAWILGNISCHRTLHTQIRLLGGIPALVYLLEAASSQGNVVMCYRAVWSLCNLASDRKCQSEIRTCNGIPMLVSHLDALNWDVGSHGKSGAHRVKLVQTVSHILSNLAVDPRNQQELLDAGAIPLLMRLIDIHMNAKVRLMASWALSNLAANPRTHHELHRADAIPNFTDLLAASAGDHWVTLRMIVAIGNLACDNAENRDMIRECGAIKLLVKNLGTSDRDLQERVCIAIENLTTDNPANQRTIINCGAAGYLKLIISSGHSATAQEKAIGIVYNICGNDYCLQEIWACGVVSSLEALASGDLCSKGGSCGASSKDRKKLQERAEQTLQRIVPSRGAILPELRLTLGSGARLDAACAASSAKAGSRGRKARQAKPSRKTRLRGALVRMCSCGPLPQWFQPDKDNSMDTSSGARITNIPYLNPMQDSKQQRPTWDSSIVHSHGVKGEKNSDLQVWDVQNLTVHCHPTPRYRESGSIAGDDVSVDSSDNQGYMFDMQRSQRSALGAA